MEDKIDHVSSNQYLMYAGTNHMDFRVAIITGVCRSGKTLLGQLLGSMRNVEHIDEPWLPRMLPVMQGKGLVDREVAGMLFQAFTEELFNDTILLRNANFRPGDHSSIWSRKGAQEIFSRLVNLDSRDDVRRYIRETDSVLLYNLAETIPYLSFLIEAFPHCKIIHVVRNGLDVAMETAGKGWFSTEQLENPRNNQVFRAYQRDKGAKKYYLPWWLWEEDSEMFLGMTDFGRGLSYWRNLLEQSRDSIIELRKTRPQIYYEVRFEDIVKESSRTLNDVAAFLDLEPTEQTAALLSAIKASAANDPSIYPIAGVPGAEWERVVKILKMFDYPVPGLK